MPGGSQAIDLGRCNVKLFSSRILAMRPTAFEDWLLNGHRQAQELLLLSLSIMVKVLVGEKTCSEAVPVFAQVSIRASNLLPAELCCKVT